MSAQGTVLLDFGAFPGQAEASAAVASAGIAAGSLAEAFLFPDDTTDHLADEHRVEQLQVAAGAVVAGVGFTVYGNATGDGLIYGKWNVGWVWA